MPKVEFYGYSRCSTCREAEAMLAALGVGYERRDLFGDRLSSAEARALFNRIGLEPSDVLATRSHPYRDLQLAGRELTEEQILNLMAEHPALIRRPLVVRGNRAVMGFKPEEIRDLVG